MPRRNRKPLPFWVSAKPNGNDGRFIQVGNSLLLSPRFQTLEATDRIVYLSMVMESGGKSDFIFPKNAAAKYGIAPRTLSRAVKRLEAAGFIQKSSGWTTREPNQYRFSMEWKRATALLGDEKDV